MRHLQTVGQLTKKIKYEHDNFVQFIQRNIYRINMTTCVSLTETQQIYYSVKSDRTLVMFVQHHVINVHYDKSMDIGQPLAKRAETR